MTYTVTLTRDLLEKAARRMDHEAGCGIESNDDCTCGTAEIHRAFAAAMASHPTPDGEAKSPTTTGWLRDTPASGWDPRVSPPDGPASPPSETESLRDRIEQRIKSSLAYSDELEAKDLGDLRLRTLQDERRILSGYLLDLPDTPASPVLGDEERERLLRDVDAFEREQCLCDPGDPRYEASSRCATCHWADRFRAVLAQGEERDG